MSSFAKASVRTGVVAGLMLSGSLVTGAPASAEEPPLITLQCADLLVVHGPTQFSCGATADSTGATLSARLGIPLVEGAAPVQLNNAGAHIKFRALGDKLKVGEIHGAICSNDPILNEELPAPTPLPAAACVATGRTAEGKPLITVRAVLDLTDPEPEE